MEIWLKVRPNLQFNLNNLKINTNLILTRKYLIEFRSTDTEGIWNPDKSGFWMVKKDGLQMVQISNGFRKPNHLKSGQMAAILSKNITNLDKNIVILNGPF